MAAKLQCEICGGKLVGKPGGIFECDSCGTEYSTEWAKAKIQEIQGTVKVEGTVEVKGSVQVEGAANVQSLIKRGYIALEDGKWDDAKKSFNDALNADPENAEAYLGIVLAKMQCCDKESFADDFFKNDIDKNIHDGLKRVKQFGSAEVKAWVEDLYRKKASETEEMLTALKEAKYAEACELQESGEVEKLEKAEEIFELLDDFKDSVERAEACVRAIEEKMAAAKARLAPYIAHIAPYQGLITISDNATVGLRENGTVIITRGRFDFSGFTDIKSISAENKHIVGLKTNSTVVAAGNNEFGQCNVFDWTDIVAVAAGDYHTVGLKSDGTVVAAGNNKFDKCNVSDWTDIIAVAAGYDHTLGLKSDGTVVATGVNCSYGQCNVSKWKYIAAIAAGQDHTVGMKQNGTVVAVGNNDGGRCDVSDWTDIVAIAAGQDHTVGLKSNGTVVAAGKNVFNQCDVGDWTDIVAIAAGRNVTVGLKEDGTVIAAGYTAYGHCRVNKWKLFRTKAEKDAIYTTACSYQKSDNLNKLAEAAALFKNLENYEDSAERLKKCEKKFDEIEIEKKEKLKQFKERIAPYQGRLKIGFTHSVGMKSNGSVVAAGKNNKGQCNVTNSKHVKAIEVGINRTYILKEDGTVTCLGDSYFFDKWTNIVAIASGPYHVAGLSAIGTVVTDSIIYEKEVSRWKNITAIAASIDSIVGLKSDGTVVAAINDRDEDKCFGKKEQSKYDVSDWRDIISIAAYDNNISGVTILGLRSDGTVVGTNRREKVYSEVTDWKDISVIAVGKSHRVVGLRANGTVISTFSSENEKISEWQDIAVIALGETIIVGLKADGNVVCTDEKISQEISKWRNIVAIEAYSDSILGLKEDGTVVAVGSNYEGRLNVSGWKLFSTEAELNAERSALQTELANLKGIFSGKRRREIEARLAQIEDELKKLWQQKEQ